MVNLDEITYEDFLKLQKKFINNENIKRKEEKISYPFRQMRHKKLRTLVNIKRMLDKTIFDKWFNSDIKLSEDIQEFLKKLLEKKGDLISLYNEEDLKMHFISQIFNHIDFTVIEKEIRFFSEESLSYEAENFIFNGEPNFFIARGLDFPEKPYFFIQEFKRQARDGYPEPQLLAELISAVELNNWKNIKGAYILGAGWYFVILEKLGIDKYRYFVSKEFNSSEIDGLTAIYKNLLFIKEEVIKMVDEGI